MNFIRGLLRTVVAGGFVVALIYIGGIWLLGAVAIAIWWYESRPSTKAKEAVKRP